MTQIQTPTKPFRVWWVPQIPMRAFYVEVDTAQEGLLLLDTLVRYDLFLLQERVRPDFSNGGGLCQWDDKDGEWYEWYDEDDNDVWDVLKQKNTGDKP